MPLYRTRQIRIRKGHRLWQYGADLCIKSAILYNRANYFLRQYATAVRDTGEGKELHENQRQVLDLIRDVTRGTRYEPKGAWLTYGELDYVLKRTDDPAYRSLPAQANQQILKRLVRDYRSFFEALKVWRKSPERFTGRPKLPGYRKKGSLVTAVLTNQICRICDDHYLRFPGTRERINLGHLKKAESIRLKEVRIKPGQEELVVEAVLALADEEKSRPGKLCGLTQEELRRRLQEEDGKTLRAAGIDPGVDNFCAIVNNFGAPAFVIKGGAAKSENHYYNKKLARLKSQAMRCNKKHSTARIKRLTDRRNRILKDMMHKASRRIADWAEENAVDVVILGHNVFQKQGISMRHADNQNFVQIPYGVFAGMLRYKLEEKGIALLETEESYTSKADYLAGDVIPVYGKEKELFEGGEAVFSGKRIRRGLYVHADGTKSNADINGAANILRKVFPNVTEWDRGVVDTPYAVRIS